MSIDLVADVGRDEWDEIDVDRKTQHDRTPGSHAIQTNWIAISGAACSGKTTLIVELARRGFGTNREAATDLINRVAGVGAPTSLVKDSQALFHFFILSHQQRQYDALSPLSVRYFDRSMVDTLVYARLRNVEPIDPFEAAARKYRYAAVFILAPLPFRGDTHRLEDGGDEQARQHRMLVDAYAKLGYSVVTIPRADVHDRVDLVINGLRMPTSRHNATGEPSLTD